MKIFLLRAFLFILLLTLSATPLRAEGEAPARLVSLAPSITEIIFALGAGDRLKGVTDFCDFPEEALKKPKVGGMTNPSLEAIVRLKPDLVVMTTDGNLPEVRKRLNDLGIKTHLFGARTISEYAEGIRTLGAALGIKKEASAVASTVEATLAELKAKGQKRKKQRGVFVVWPEPLVVAGPGTFTNEAMAMVGIENIAEDAKAAWPRFSLEELIRRSPDVIFASDTHQNDPLFRDKFIKKLAIVPAVKEGRVFFTSDALMRLGPRTLGGVKELDNLLHGEKEK